MATTTSTADLLRPVLADLTQVVAGIRGGQLHDPTPCSEYDVAQLRDHTVGWLTNFAAGLADPHGQAAADIKGYVPSADPAAEVRAAADRLDRAVRDGAADRELRRGDSRMPGGMALSMILWEFQVHGWDLARATGQEWAPHVAAVQESLDFLPTVLTPENLGEGKPISRRVPVPADPPSLDRLLGLSGRDPRWSPPA